MSRYRVAVLGIAGLFGVVGCGATDAAPPVSGEEFRVSLLPGAADLPPGAVVERLPREDQMVLSLKLDAPSTGDGSEATTTFDPPACEAENAYSDGARIGLVDNGSAAGALLGDDRAYIMLVSEADLDVQRMADAHTGSCATYTVAYDDPASFGRTVRTERLDLPPELASEDAVIVSEVTHSDNPNWADDEVLLGYAAVGDYTVLVLAYHGKEFRTEFDDVFTRTVEKVRSHA
ncbi:hypothetical protein [Prescottella equi]|uniref:hypothetical protein n=1 Tax=Rhodococcus hoagii TaxID=43767 RepID=UPI0019DDFDFD|nr:hypothetical protein [Prescottella equi]NKS48201.1 hypothetical protein [Prescottella equi]WJJ12081.1 hypothetical protein P9990_01725 [Prescottella equi]